MPNIAIYEGGKAARMNGVSRITTDDGNGGKVTWVPQSERQTGTLYVSENGTYRAEDEGLHSWSKVTVRLAGAPLGLEVPTLPDPITGAEIPTGELGELEPVPPAGLEPIEEEVISSDEAENIMEEAGLDPSDLDPDSPNYDDAIEAIADALGVDPDDVKIVDPDDAGTVKEAEPKVEDNGQQATGTDPETGEQATITPSGKEGADELVELVLVSGPDKTRYRQGELIEYSGVVVRAKYSSGKTENVPFEELEFEPYTCPGFGEATGDIIMVDGSVFQRYRFERGIYYTKTYYDSFGNIRTIQEEYRCMWNNAVSSGDASTEPFTWYMVMYNGFVYYTADVERSFSFYKLYEREYDSRDGGGSYHRSGYDFAVAVAGYVVSSKYRVARIISSEIQSMFGTIPTTNAEPPSNLNGARLVEYAFEASASWHGMSVSFSLTGVMSGDRLPE